MLSLSRAPVDKVSDLSERREPMPPGGSGAQFDGACAISDALDASGTTGVAPPTMKLTGSGSVAWLVPRALCPEVAGDLAPSADKWSVGRAFAALPSADGFIILVWRTKLVGFWTASMKCYSRSRSFMAAASDAVSSAALWFWFLRVTRERVAALWQLS